MNQKSDSDNSSERNWLVSTFWAIFTVALVAHVWPEILPVKSVFDLWTTKESFLTWLLAGWPIYLWGVGVNIVFQLIRVTGDSSYDRFLRRLRGEPSALKILFGGTALSIFAGVMEEIAFRWLLFFSAIASVTLTNFLCFGFLGFGIPEWLYLNIMGPVVNWLSFGALQPWLAHAAGWQVGAGLLSANAFFRDGHRYQGWLGWLNSWFLGLFFFWLVLTYGLPSAIVVHTVYDLLIHVVSAVTQRVRHGAWI